MLVKSSSELGQAVTERLQYQPDMTHIAGHPFQSPFQDFLRAKHQSASDPLMGQSKALGCVDASTVEAIAASAAASAASAASMHMSKLLGYAPRPTGEQPESLGSSPGSTSPGLVRPCISRSIHGVGGVATDAQSMAARMRSDLERAVAAAAAEPGEPRLPSSFAALARNTDGESRCATPLTAPCSASSSCLSLVGLLESSTARLRHSPEHSAAADAPHDQLRQAPPSPSVTPTSFTSGWMTSSRMTPPFHMSLLSNTGATSGQLPAMPPIDAPLRPAITPATTAAPTPLTQPAAAPSPLIEASSAPLPPRLAALPSPRQATATCPDDGDDDDDDAGAPWAMPRAESTSPPPLEPPPLPPPSGSHTTQQITVLSSGPGGGALPRIADLRSSCTDGLLLLSSTAYVLSRDVPFDPPKAKRQKI